MSDLTTPQATSTRERWSQIRASAANVLRAFRLSWEAHRLSTLGMAACTLVGALLPAAQAWVAKLIVDSVVGSLSAQVDPLSGLQAIAPLLLAEAVLVVMQALNVQLRTLSEHVLHARLNLSINTRIIRKALELDLMHFENAEYYDKLQNARREADWRGLRIVNGSFYLVQNLITLGTFALLLIRFSPWLALLLFVATLPAFIAQSRYAELNFRVLSWRAPEARRLSYLEHLLTDYDAVKEVKLFSLGEPLLGRYADLFWSFLREDQVIAQKRSLASLGWGLLATLTYYGAYAWIVWRTLAGAITLGEMTMYLSIFRSSQSTFESIFFELSELYENGLFMSNLFSFLELQPMMVQSASPVPVPRPLQVGIEFREVSFRYPGQENWALRQVSFAIRPGEKIALVGPNGAGKTTIVKLITRLYDPSEGQVLLDGVDLREYDLDQLRHRIGVIFQDFVHYHLSAAENIGLGQVEALNDRGRIERAAAMSGADSVIAGLAEGYDTTLGRWFTRGRDLSGGEWQKIALARAFMRDCEILILDEPTASLDAENEFQVFQQFRMLTAERTAILISHRFSTVRMADCIYVVEGGTIKERGSHADLLALSGLYAHLFTLQAESYR